MASRAQLQAVQTYRSRHDPNIVIVAQVIGGFRGITLEGNTFEPGDYLCTNAFGVEFGLHAPVFHRLYVRI